MTTATNAADTTLTTDGIANGLANGVANGVTGAAAEAVADTAVLTANIAGDTRAAVTNTTTGVGAAAAGVVADTAVFTTNIAGNARAAVTETAAGAAKVDEISNAAAAAATAKVTAEVEKKSKHLAFDGLKKATKLMELYSMTTMQLVFAGIGYTLKAFLNLALAPFFLVLIPLYFHLKCGAFYYVMARELFSQPPEGIFCKLLRHISEGGGGGEEGGGAGQAQEKGGEQGQAGEVAPFVFHFAISFLAILVVFYNMTTFSGISSAPLRFAMLSFSVLLVLAIACRMALLPSSPAVRLPTRLPFAAYFMNIFRAFKRMSQYVRAEPVPNSAAAAGQSAKK